MEYNILMSVKSKAKGNSFELRLSKLLSEWMFNEKDLLWRDSTSGGRKVIYNGDIVPAKVENFPWKYWPFIIEAKYGYKPFIPTFFNFEKIKHWLKKLLNERTETQHIPLLIVQFYNRRPLLITNILLNSFCEICITVLINDNYDIFYIYDLKTLLSERFDKIFPNELYEPLILNKDNI